MGSICNNAVYFIIIFFILVGAYTLVRYGCNIVERFSIKLHFLDWDLQFIWVNMK